MADEHGGEWALSLRLQQNAAHRKRVVFVGPSLAVELKAGQRLARAAAIGLARRRVELAVEAGAPPRAFAPYRQSFLMLGVVIGLAGRSLEHIGRIDAEIVAADIFGALHHIHERTGRAGAGGVEHLEIELRLLVPGEERAGPRAVLGVVVAAQAVLSDEAAASDAVVADGLHLAGTVEAADVQRDQQSGLLEGGDGVIDGLLDRIEPQLVRVFAAVAGRRLGKSRFELRLLHVDAAEAIRIGLRPGRHVDEQDVRVAVELAGDFLQEFRGVLGDRRGPKRAGCRSATNRNEP